jgi:hypothetical protein
MHKRHGEGVTHVLEQQLRIHAAEVVDGTLEPTSLLAMVATREHLPADKQALATSTEIGTVNGKFTPSRSVEAPVAAILRVEASLQTLHAKIDAGTARKATKRANSGPSKRHSIAFAAILLELTGMKYCSFLTEHGVRPRWSEPCPSGYCAGYLAGDPWRKKIQDEKSRARVRMENYTDTVLADALNFYLPNKFEELTALLHSRNSRPASKTSASSKAHKH